MLPIIIFLSILPAIYGCAATSSTSSPVLVCSTCAQVREITMTGVGTDQPITQTVGTNGDGCRTITVTCTSATAGSQVVFFWTEQGADRGTSQGTTTVSRTLVCDSNGDLILTEPATGGVGVVDEVECVSP